MRRLIVAGLTAAALVVALPSGASAAQKPSKTAAMKAIKRELSHRYGIDPVTFYKVHVYECDRLTAKRFKCSWDADSTLDDDLGKYEADAPYDLPDMEGIARVTFHGTKADVTLTGAR